MQHFIDIQINIDTLAFIIGFCVPIAILSAYFCFEPLFKEPEEW